MINGSGLLKKARWLGNVAIVEPGQTRSVPFGAESQSPARRLSYSDTELVGLMHRTIQLIQVVNGQRRYNEFRRCAAHVRAIVVWLHK